MNVFNDKTNNNSSIKNINHVYIKRKCKRITDKMDLKRRKILIKRNELIQFSDPGPEIKNFLVYFYFPKLLNRMFDCSYNRLYCSMSNIVNM